MAKIPTIKQQKDTIGKKITLLRNSTVAWGMAQDYLTLSIAHAKEKKAAPTITEFVAYLEKQYDELVKTEQI